MLETQLTKQILRTTDTYIKSLNKAWILTVWDFLNILPRDFEDRTNVIDTFSFVNIKETNTLLVEVVSLDNQKTWNWKLLTKLIIKDKNGFMSECVWFNRNYLATKLNVLIWKKVIISGKAKYDFWKLSFLSPEIETDLSKVWWEIVPIYSDTNYIPGTWIASKMDCVKSYVKYIEDILPLEIIKKYNFISRSEAFLKMHFPVTNEDINQAKYMLAYEELFVINYKTLSKKAEKNKESLWKSISIALNAELVKEIISKLPFDLTNGQKIALFQVLKDMEKNHWMLRLLEWDVWTGKTVIAMISTIHSILEYRVLHFNPTDILTSPPTPLLQERGEEVSMIENYSKVPEYVKDLSKNFRKNPTNYEDFLWSVLRNRQLNNIKFRRQHPFWRYIADFYSDELRLVIELDWKIHENQKEYDEIRDEIISKYWVTILRFKNEDLLNNFNEVISKILNTPSPVGEGARGWGFNKNKGIFQVAIMAPTEILARQHFTWEKDFLESYWLRVELLVWSTTKKQKEIIKEQIKSWLIDVIIWTHALLQDDILFCNLWYVIIDEQHRFWVKQRDILEKWLGNMSWVIPHSLNMTATPIPRTLALTLYWDQDLSVISEYPKDRKIIHTKVIKNEEDREQVQLFISNELAKWRQVFWISPLVEESEKIDLANAINTFETLTEIFSPYKVGLLHWKMKAKEKDEIMQAFANNEIQILSSTSVVEVWINVPNATIMCIEGAERFWLSQLHQFRWRVWRWKYQSYCYLFPTTGNNTDRLRAMEKTNNWFELSEIDLELRWPWEVYGVRQSWVPDLKIADLKDLELISQIRTDIEEMLEKKG